MQTGTFCLILAILCRILHGIKSIVSYELVQDFSGWPIRPEAFGMEASPTKFLCLRRKRNTILKDKQSIFGILALAFGSPVSGKDTGPDQPNTCNSGR